MVWALELRPRSVPTLLRRILSALQTVEFFFQLFASSPKLASRRLRLDFTSHNGSVVIMPKFQIAVELPVPIKVVAKCEDDHCIVNLFLKCVGSFNKQLQRLFLFQGCIDW